MTITVVYLLINQLSGGLTMADNVVQDLELLVYLTYSFHFTMQLLYIRLRLLLDT